VNYQLLCKSTVDADRRGNSLLSPEWPVFFQSENLTCQENFQTKLVGEFLNYFWRTVVIANFLALNFRVPLYGKYLSFAFVALGIVLSWGYLRNSQPRSRDLLWDWRLFTGYVFKAGSLKTGVARLYAFGAVWSNYHWLGCHSKVSVLP
jgi:hypothetical protein